MRSDLLGAAYPSGPGRHVTIWSNPGHVFVTIDGRDWGTGKLPLRSRAGLWRSVLGGLRRQPSTRALMPSASCRLLSRASVRAP